MSQRSFSIKPVPPFRLDLMAWALRRRPENAIDRLPSPFGSELLDFSIQVKVQQRCRKTSDFMFPSGLGLFLVIGFHDYFPTPAINFQSRASSPVVGL